MLHRYKWEGNKNEQLVYLGWPFLAGVPEGQFHLEKLWKDLE